MGELIYPQSSHEWAWEKGIYRKCARHGIKYDPNVGCSKCKEEERKKKLREAFENVIWPDNNSTKK